MTSEHTGEPTERFFAKNSYFGLDRKNVHFFEQNTMPCVDMSGKIILETKSSIAKAPGEAASDLLKCYFAVLMLGCYVGIIL